VLLRHAVDTDVGEFFFGGAGKGKSVDVILGRDC
jgi:hypothetical protein